MKQIILAVLILIGGRIFAQDTPVEPSLKSSSGTVTAGEFNWMINTVKQSTDTTEVYTKTRSDGKYATIIQNSAKADAVSPNLVTPNIGAATATTVNGNIVPTGAKTIATTSDISDSLALLRQQIHELQTDITYLNDAIHALVPPYSPSVNAGYDTAYMEKLPFAILTSDSIHCDSINWTTSGTGTFNNHEAIHPTYTVSDADFISGSVTLTITGYYGAQTDVDQMTIVFNFAADYYVATNGNDNNPGTFSQPWATWDKAFNGRSPGDVVCFRGGVYSMTVAGSAGYDRDVVGTASDSIIFFNYPGEVPILDCGNVTPAAGSDHHALTLHLTYARISGLVVRNVWQVYATTEVQALTIVGDHAVVDNCTVYNTHGRGFWVVNSDNTILKNCDSYNNCDSLTSALPGNDGYGYFIQDQEVNTRTVTLINCRAWNNGDDGFTCYSESRVDFQGCWAFNNGQLEGEGHGFKLGWLNTEYAGLRRVVTNCLAANNLSDGINTNDEPGVSAAAVMNVFNNTSYNNATSSVGGDAYGFIIFNTASADAREQGRVFRNNIAYNNTAGHIFIGPDALITATYNSWNLGVTVNSSDFVSTNAAPLDDARGISGNLPNTNGFLELAPGSDLINAGVNVGLPYLGSAPDLGYVERQ
jgi:parallel beta-helix repeat protein